MSAKDERGPTPYERYREYRLSMYAVWVSIWLSTMFQVTQGLIYLFADRTRFNSMMFDAPEFFFSLRVWGTIFLAVGLVTVAVMRRSLRWTINCLRVSGTLMLFYAFTFFVAAINDNTVPWGQGLLYFYVSFHMIGASQFVRPVREGSVSS